MTNNSEDQEEYNCENCEKNFFAEPTPVGQLIAQDFHAYVSWGLNDTQHLPFMLRRKCPTCLEGDKVNYVSKEESID